MIASIAGHGVASGRTSGRRQHAERPRATCPRSTACPHEAASKPPERPARAATRPLEGLQDEATPLAVPTRVTAAARAFSAGNGYLTGLLVDRIA
jgi:hypothetical protein